MKTSLGIWAFGNMATRFNAGGYKPELTGISTVQKVRTAVEGLGELIDDYEFHYPQALARQPRPGARRARRARDLLHRERAPPRCTLRQGRLRLAGRRHPRGGAAADARGDRPRRRDGAQMIIWPGIEGYNYPFQTPYKESWARFVDGVGQAAQHAKERGVAVFLEHKNSEPAMKILMRNIGMTLHVIHSLRREGIDNVTVNMDWQHLLMNGESLAEYAAMLAAEGLLGHQHANDGWGTFDDDNMVGTIRFMETLELAVELRRAGYGENGERLGFDLYPYTEDAVGAVKRSVLHWRFIDGIASGSTTPSSGRRSRRRTRCGPTSSSTRPWAREAPARLRRDRRRRRRRGARVLRRPARPRGEARAAEARPGRARLVRPRRRPRAASDADRRRAAAECPLLHRGRRRARRPPRPDRSGGGGDADADRDRRATALHVPRPFGNLLELTQLAA